MKSRFWGVHIEYNLIKYQAPEMLNIYLITISRYSLQLINVIFLTMNLIQLNSKKKFGLVRNGVDNKSGTHLIK